MADRIRVMLVPTFREPEIIEVENTLDEFQRLVGGYIEMVTCGRVIVICDEEGRLKGKSVNPHATNFVGDLVVCMPDGEEFGSLTDEMIVKLNKLLEL